MAEQAGSQHASERDRARWPLHHADAADKRRMWRSLRLCSSEHSVLHLDVGVYPLLAPSDVVRWVAPAAGKVVQASKGMSSCKAFRTGLAAAAGLCAGRPGPMQPLHARSMPSATWPRGLTHLSGQRCITA